MVGATGLEHEFNLRLIEADLHLGTIVDGLQDIGLKGCNESREPGERPGTVEDLDPKVNAATGTHEAPIDDPGNEIHVDISATNHEHDLLALELILIPVECAQYNGRTSLDQQLALFHEAKHVHGDFFFVRGVDLIHQGQQEIEHVGICLLNCDPVGKCAKVRALDQRPGLERAGHRAHIGRLAGHNLDRGFQAFECRPHPGTKPTTSDRSHDIIDLRKLREDLETERTLPGNDERVMKGVHIGTSGFLHDPLSREKTLVVIVPLKMNGGSEGLGIRYFHEWRGFRHHDQSRGVEVPGPPGHSLRMIAGTGGDHPAFFLVFGQFRDPVGRATDLEGSDGLERLKLEKHLTTVQAREGLVPDQG